MRSCKEREREREGSAKNTVCGSRRRRRRRPQRERTLRVGWATKKDFPNCTYFILLPSFVPGTFPHPLCSPWTVKQILFLWIRKLFLQLGVCHGSYSITCIGFNLCSLILIFISSFRDHFCVNSSALWAYRF